MSMIMESNSIRVVRSRLNEDAEFAERDARDPDSALRSSENFEDCLEEEQEENRRMRVAPSKEKIKLWIIKSGRSLNQYES